MESGLAHDQIKDESGGVATDVVSAVDIQTQLVRELREKFRVFDPRIEPDYDHENPPPTPEGMTSYWDWYERMKNEWFQKAYDAIICSACPFSEGMKRMRDLGHIPCGTVRGSIYHLPHPSKCGMTHVVSNWTHEELYVNVLEEAGVEGLRALIAKELELEDTQPDQNFMM